jgi:hypothetical protein
MYDMQPGMRLIDPLAHAGYLGLYVLLNEGDL